MSQTAADVDIIGGGHNGLVAGVYLARAGRRVVILEARSELGGAVASTEIFAGIPARLSRFSYLVSMLPDQIADELGLELELASRTVKFYAPIGGSGLLVERPERDTTRESFRRLTGSDHEYAAWQDFETELARVAAAVAPTLTGPLPRAAEIRERVGTAAWGALTERPIGDWIEASFADDTVRGAVLTDALIGTFSYAHDPSLRQNRCFLYHVIGNGSGEWKVPVGGMGRVAEELTRVAARAGVVIRTGAPATSLTPGDRGGTVYFANGDTVTADTMLAGCAPAVLDRLLGRPSVSPEGSQLKINLVLQRLPRLASGLDPEVGFAGTMHLGQGYAELQWAYEVAAAGTLPDPLPCEVYCHTLTDPSILDPELRAAGYQTLTLFGLHTPAGLFRADPVGSRRQAADAAVRSLQAVLAEPLADCLALDRDGRPCLEVMTPVDIEAELGMPGGHIFHGDLSWPWLADDADARTPAQRWGVATGYEGIMLCGSGATRGGAVSGLGGHNAAMAVLEGG